MTNSQGDWMIKKIIILIIALCYGAIAQVNLTGTVTDNINGAPVPGVAVTLKALKLSDTTDAQGQYQIIDTLPTRSGRSSAGFISGSRLIGDHLRITLAQSSPVVVELFTAAGKKMATPLRDENLSEGTYDINLGVSGLKTGLYLIRVRQGNQCWIHQYLSFQTMARSALTNNRVSGDRNGTAKKVDAAAIAVDTLVFSKSGYDTLLIPIQSYTGIVYAVLKMLPFTPAISSVTAGDGNVTIKWDTAFYAKSFNLYYATGTTVDKANSNRITGVTSPELVTGLTDGIQYAFAISALNTAGESGLSAIMTATPQIQLPRPGPLSYLQNPASYFVGVAITANICNNGGGKATSFSITRPCLKVCLLTQSAELSQEHRQPLLLPG